MINHQKVFNIKEVAKYLGVHASTIYKYAQSGRIPSFKMGSDWRFSKKHIDQWIDEQTRQEIKGTNDLSKNEKTGERK